MPTARFGPPVSCEATFRASCEAGKEARCRRATPGRLADSDPPEPGLAGADRAGQRPSSMPKHLRARSTRIAHEVIKRNDDLGGHCALIRIHTRGALLAPPSGCRRLIEGGARGSCEVTRRREAHVPPGRPRSRTRSRARPSEFHATNLDFPLAGTTCVLVNIYTAHDRGALRAGAAGARPASPCSSTADVAELRSRPDYVGNLPTARSERRSRCSSRSPTASTRSCLTSRRRRPWPRRRHLLSIADLDQDDVERILETALLKRLRQPVADAGRAARADVVLRVLDPNLVKLSWRQSSCRRHHVDPVRGLGREGESLKGGTVLTLAAYEPAAIVSATRASVRPGSSHATVLGGSRERGRRNAPASHPGAARPLHAADHLRQARRAARRDRRRRPALACRALARPGPPARRSRRHDVGPRRSYRERSRRAAARARPSSRRSSPPTSSTSSGCSGNGCSPEANYVPSLREYNARWGITPERLRPGQKVMHPGPMNPGRRDRRPGRGLSRSLVAEQARSSLPSGWRSCTTSSRRAFPAGEIARRSRRC